ncbi:MAG: hypothetical protein ACRC33_01090 [Gemmataceae bacterium]
MHPRAVPLLVLGLTFTAALLAQDGGIAESESDFYDKKLKATKALRGSLSTGETVTDVNNKAHAEAIDISAKEITYPLYWQGRSMRTERTEPSKLIKETVDLFENRLRLLGGNKEQSSVAAYQALYCKAVTRRAQEVVLAGPPVASVNAARMIAMIPHRTPGLTTKEWADRVTPRLTNDSADQILAVAADLVAADPKRLNDGVRIFLLRAAHDILALPKQTPPLYKQATADKAVVAAMGVATRKVTFPKATPRGEVEGFKMLRAEALRVVAWAATPSIGKDRPALLLAQVAANDQAVSPPPREEELVEAVIGLCRLMAAPSKMPEMNADYAAMQVARGVAAIGNEANKNVEVKSATTRLRPWKVDAARLLEAVDALRGIKDPYVVEMLRQARPVLLDMELGRVTQSGNLSTWITGEVKPASAALFKAGDPSAVKPRGVPDDE